MTFTEANIISFLQGYFGNAGSVDLLYNAMEALFSNSSHSVESSLRESLVNANMKPDNDGSISDAESIVSNVPLLSILNIAGGVTFDKEWSERRYGGYADKIDSRITLNTNPTFNKTILDYATTIYHEMRHHFFEKSGIRKQMVGSMIDGKRIGWDVINRERLGFNEYQASYFTKGVSEGKHMWNEIGLNGIQECFIMESGFKTQDLIQLYRQYERKYFKKDK